MTHSRIASLTCTLLLLAACSSSPSPVQTANDAAPPDSDGGEATTSPNTLPNGGGGGDAGDAATGAGISGTLCTWSVPVEMPFAANYAVDPMGTVLYVYAQQKFPHPVLYRYTIGAACSLSLDLTFGTAGEIHFASTDERPYNGTLVATTSSLFARVGPTPGSRVHRIWPPSSNEEDCALEGSFAVADNDLTGLGLLPLNFDYVFQKLAFGGTCSVTDAGIAITEPFQPRSVDIDSSGSVVATGLGGVFVFDKSTGKLTNPERIFGAEHVRFCGGDICSFSFGTNGAPASLARRRLDWSVKRSVRLDVAVPSVPWRKNNTNNEIGAFTRTGIAYVPYVDAGKLGLARIEIP